MGFENLDKDAGLTVLNNFLEEHSYIDGYTATQADVAVFEAIKGPVPAKFPHVARWYNHINARGGKTAKFPGVKKAASAYGPAVSAPVPARAASPVRAKSPAKPAPAAAPAKKVDDEEDFDLFGSDDEEEDAAKAAVTAQRLKEYNEKKAAKPKPVAKSMVILDVKPWDDETDMKAMEESVRSISMEGLVWGTSKLVAIGYGIKKLQITAVVEDDKVGVDDLSDQISAFEDYVQSVDVASFNKL
ncbi:Elongation factor 1-beta [Entophlyctis luteolus]|nr:Elongation factor 1-beta [Entophlyctis luteolus]KAJ3343535.1 Elongation factor 1-beta [Entophlyctis luteolus]KAJ3380444.1 Elongation factor 1-beta [Entophlyctis sp. JEL0112]